MASRKKIIIFTFNFDTELEQWFWHSNDGKHSSQGFELKKDCTNDAIINGYEANKIN